MLKRNIVILIAGAVLGAQVNLAAAGQGNFPLSADEGGMGLSSTLPALTNYLEQRAATLEKQGAVLGGTSFPRSADDMYWDALPAQARYLEARAASVEKQAVAVRGNSFPASADDMYWNMLPAQARYFDQRTATLHAGKPEDSAPSGE